MPPLSWLLVGSPSHWALSLRFPTRTWGGISFQHCVCLKWDNRCKAIRNYNKGLSFGGRFLVPRIKLNKLWVWWSPAFTWWCGVSAVLTTLLPQQWYLRCWLYIVQSYSYFPLTPDLCFGFPLSLRTSSVETSREVFQVRLPRMWNLCFLLTILVSASKPQVSVFPSVPWGG